MPAQYKSDEEAAFAEWLAEAEQEGLVEWWKYEPQSFEIVSKQFHDNGKFAFHPTEYTPDFQFKLTERGEICLPMFAKYADHGHVWIEIKGRINPKVRTSEGLTDLKRKLVYKMWFVFVEKIRVPDIFLKTWLPHSMWFTKKTGKPAQTKLTRNCVDIDTYLERVHGVQGELL